ncbi:MAG: general secretion pathway protein GspC [Labilithrix sp.]|nr:general secretion pathway protein GspC [Labilithrix sp.]MCW5813282.1 general secretion pathway protein GspC [Labilithrix sp.]
MAFAQLLRKHFWVVPLPLLATAALLNAQAVTQLVGATMAVDEKDLARAPNVSLRGAGAAGSASARSTDGSPIIHRNAFDHVAGPLDTKPVEESGDGEPTGPIDTSDPWSAPACEGVVVKAIAASDDEAWSFASFAGEGGKPQLARRGSDVGGKTVHFIGWDRVWLTSSGQLCQASLFDAKKAPPPAAPAPAPAASSSAAPSTGARRGAPPLSADMKSGIKQVSPTEFQIDRGILDKILENQAELMRQARVVPVQENGKVVGVRLNGIKSDALLGVLGMQNGDTLKTINGFDMGSPEKALEAYARLRTADKLTISLSRGGKDMNIDYAIK